MPPKLDGKDARNACSYTNTMTRQMIHRLEIDNLFDLQQISKQDNGVVDPDFLRKSSNRLPHSQR